jgi:hypothetical protein
LFTDTGDLGSAERHGPIRLDFEGLTSGIVFENRVDDSGSHDRTLPDLLEIIDGEFTAHTHATNQPVQSYHQDLVPLLSPRPSPSLSQLDLAFIESDTLLDENPPDGTITSLISPIDFPRANQPASILYCPMPWPDDMLASSERRFLWRYFLSVAENDFLCLDWADVGHLYGFQHPYLTSLPQLSLRNKTLRNAVFSFSATQYQLRQGRPDFAAVRRLSSSEASHALQLQRSEQDDDGSQFLSMIYALPLLHFFSSEQHGDMRYLRMGSGWVSKFLAKINSVAQDSQASAYEVPLTEFRWAVISTLCALTWTKKPLGSQLCRTIEMKNEELSQKYFTAFRGWVSHPIYTFSPRLVNPLLRIGSLLEAQLFHMDHPGVDYELTTGQATQINEVEEMLLHARDCDLEETAPVPGSMDPAAVIALNESMYAASNVLLYARLRCLPFTTPFVRKQVHRVVDEIAKINVTSHVSYSTIFPLFVAGCEATDWSVRDVIKERLRNPGGIAYNRGDLVAALENIWEIRDHDPGLPWPLWVGKSKWQFPSLSLPQG